MAEMLWKMHTLKTGEILTVCIGQINLFIKDDESEWHIAHKKLDTLCGSVNINITNTVDETDIEWQRWVKPPSKAKFNIKPIMPDRGVVVRPEHPIKIPVNTKAQFFVGVPLALQVIMDYEKTVLCETNMAQLSNIWFGTPESGELCYSLKSAIRRDWNNIEFNPMKAICPVTIHNQSEEILQFQRMLIPAKYIGVFASKEQLWTHPIILNYQGEASHTDIKVTKKPPAFQKGAVLLTEPREIAGKSLVQRSFSNIIKLRG